MFKADSISYLCRVNDDTLEFTKLSDMFRYVRDLYSNGVQINSLSMCKVKIYQISSKFNQNGSSK